VEEVVKVARRVMNNPAALGGLLAVALVLVLLSDRRDVE
jgi:hypothetical protein